MSIAYLKVESTIVKSSITSKVTKSVISRPQFKLSQYIFAVF